MKRLEIWDFEVRAEHVIGRRVNKVTVCMTSLYLVQGDAGH